MLPSHAGLFKLLLVVSYAGFLFNASATMSSLILIDKLGEMGFLNRNPRPVDQNTVNIPMCVYALLSQFPLAHPSFDISGRQIDFFALTNLTQTGITCKLTVSEEKQQFGAGNLMPFLARFNIPPSWLRVHIPANSSIYLVEGAWGCLRSNSGHHLLVHPTSNYLHIPQ